MIIKIPIYFEVVGGNFNPSQVNDLIAESQIVLTSKISKRLGKTFQGSHAEKRITMNLLTSTQVKNRVLKHTNSPLSPPFPEEG